MLLSLLSRKEKLKFLDLGIYMIDIDGKPNEVEQRLLDMMFAEVGADIVDEYSVANRSPIEDTIAYFCDCNRVVKNIVFLNLAKVTLVDDLYNTSEHLFLEEIQRRFEITADKRRQIMGIIYEERDIKEKARRAIEE